MAKSGKKEVLVFKLLLVLGMLASLFLVYEHFSPEASKFCNFGAQLDCGVVNKSPYANIDGISYLMTIDWQWPLPLVDFSGQNALFDVLTSNAFLGFLTLLFVFFLFSAYQKGKDFLWIKSGRAVLWMRCILSFGIFYGLFLFYIQHSVLKTYCVFCLSLDVVLLLSCFMAWRMKP